MVLWSKIRSFVCNHSLVVYFVIRNQIIISNKHLYSSNISKVNVDSEFRHPLVIGHRGACGYVPEHTLGSYALAILMGADYIEPDLVTTKDNHLISRHDNELGLTTDIALRPEFVSRRKNKTVDGHELHGWFCEDFTLAELKTLRAIERIPDIRPGNTRLNGTFQIPTFQEIINLAKGLQISQRRVVGLYPEIKHASYFRKLGLPMEKAVVDMFHKNGYEGVQAPACIQSFEICCLKTLKNMTDIRLMQLFDLPEFQPFDQFEIGTKLTYGNMTTPEGLREVAKYAYAVGPHTSYIIPRDHDNRLGSVTNFVENAHQEGLKVYPYTFCAENYFLSAEYIGGDRLPSTFGNFTAYLQVFYSSGIDGIFCDHPDVPVRLRNLNLKYSKLLH